MKNKLSEQLNIWTTLCIEEVQAGLPAGAAILNLYARIRGPFTQEMLENYNSARGTTMQTSKELLAAIEDTWSSKDDIIRALSEAAAQSDDQKIHDILMRHVTLIMDRLYQATSLGLLDKLRDEGYTQYMYLSTVGACKDCQQLNGKRFDLADAKIGVNAPPLHPNCRCMPMPPYLKPPQRRQTVSYVPVLPAQPITIPPELAWQGFTSMAVEWGKDVINFIFPGSWERGQKWMDSPYDFFNWLLMGIPDAYQVQDARAEKIVDSPYDFFNWLTMGTVETVHRAVMPEEPFSWQHWLDSFHVALLTVPIMKIGSLAARPTVVRIQQQSMHDIKRDRTIIMQEIRDKSVAGWPKNEGFAGTPKEIILKPGKLIDRYGEPTGKYASPKGTPFAMRALPEDYRNGSYYVYEVLQPVSVKSGRAARWFGQMGGGTQYMFDVSIQELLDSGILREVDLR